MTDNESDLIIGRFTGPFRRRERKPIPGNANRIEFERPVLDSNEIVMMPAAKIMVFAALMLLTAAAWDLIVVDFWSLATCDEGSSSGKSYPDDDCFCCCTHIVMAGAPVQIELGTVFEDISPLPTTFLAKVEPARIYHPPRA